MTTRSCASCKSELSGEARFCSRCGATASPSLESERREGLQIGLVCPKCKSQNVYDIPVAGFAPGQICPKCKCKFTVRCLTIRAKRSTGSKREGTRKFSVRVVDSNGLEKMIDFVNASYSDFELRSKDQACFLFVKGDLRLIQNLTIGEYYTVSNPSCFLATMVYGPTSPEVVALRAFRDQVLLRHPRLSWLVPVYYAVARRLVLVCTDKRMLVAATRAGLAPIVSVTRRWHAGLKSND